MAPPRPRWARSHDAQDGHVILHHRNAGLGAIADHLADVVDLAVALRTLAQHDVGILRAGDVARAKRQRDRVQSDTERFNTLAQAREPSTDQFSSNFAEGRLLQMWLTPNAAKTRSAPLLESCCVPSFITPGAAGPPAECRVRAELRRVVNDLRLMWVLMPDYFLHHGSSGREQCRKIRPRIKLWN